MVKSYKTKPVIKQAIQWTGDNTDEVLEFTGYEDYVYVCDKVLKIQTLEGVMTARKNDYIVNGLHGEFYPCEPDIFEKTYEEIKE